MKDQQDAVDYMKYVNPIKVNGERINFTETAEHVGVVRSVSGNLPSLLAQISALKKSLWAVLHFGLARSNGGNPFRNKQIYFNSVLFSGIVNLVSVSRNLI